MKEPSYDEEKPWLAKRRSRATAWRIGNHGQAGSLTGVVEVPRETPHAAFMLLETQDQNLGAAPLHRNADA
ncbi:MAG: hypothetical protein ACJAVR_001325 [Paracoccaceae bacterium]